VLASGGSGKGKREVEGRGGGGEGEMREMVLKSQWVDMHVRGFA